MMETPLPRPVGGDQTKSLAIHLVVTIFFAIEAITVILRMITRRFLTKCVGWDDWFCVGALIGSTIGTSFIYTELTYGYGRHRYYLDDHQYREFKKFVYFDWIQVMIVLMLSKISICLLLLRITIAKVLIRPIQALIGLLVLSHLSLVSLWILQCRPLDGAWDMSKKSNCFETWQVDRIILVQAIISIVSDVILAAFPILILYRVQISFRLKIALCGLMGLGVITAGCCTTRAVLNWQNGSDDVTWVSIPTFLWKVVEVNLGLATICLPTLLPLYRYFFPKPPPSRPPVPSAHHLNNKTPRPQNPPHQDDDEGHSRATVVFPRKTSSWQDSVDVDEDIELPLQNFDDNNSKRTRDRDRHSYPATGESIFSQRSGDRADSVWGGSETRMERVFDVV